MSDVFVTVSECLLSGHGGVAHERQGTAADVKRYYRQSSETGVSPGEGLLSWGCRTFGINYGTAYKHTYRILAMLMEAQCRPRLSS